MILLFRIIVIGQLAHVVEHTLWIQEVKGSNPGHAIPKVLKIHTYCRKPEKKSLIIFFLQSSEDPMEGIRAKYVIVIKYRNYYKNVIITNSYMFAMVLV